MKEPGCCSKTGKALRGEFVWDGFSLAYSPGDVFYKSQWQRSSRSFWWLLYRWCAAGFFIGVVFSSGVTAFNGGTYFIYLTDWGIILCMVATTYGAVLTTIWHFRRATREDYIETNASLKVYWGLHYSALVLAIVITVMFWSFLYPGMPEVGGDPYNILEHACNSVVMVLDHMLVAFPTRILHFIYPLAIGIIYLLFSVIYYCAGGTDAMGNQFIYPILDWGEKPGEAVGSAIGAMVFCIIFSFFAYGLYKLRVYLHTQFFNIPSPHMIPA